MVPKLYTMKFSPPCRSVYLTAEALGVKLNHTEINLPENQQLQPDFQKVNPQHTLPTLEDDGKTIWDSHAINIYLVSKYSKDDSLYPKDSYKRAVVNQRLHFDSGVVFSLVRRIIRLMKYKGVKMVPEDLKLEGVEAYEFLEKFLDGHLWTAGDSVTLADFSLLASVTSLDVLVPIDPEKFPNIVAWIKRGQQLPYYYLNQNGLIDFREFMKELMS